MSRLFPGLVPTDTGTPVTPQRAYELRQKDRQQRDDHFLPYYANLRDGELVEPEPRFPWVAAALIATAVFWVTLGLIIITG